MPDASHMDVIRLCLCNAGLPSIFHVLLAV